MPRPFQLIDVFGEYPFSGNPLAVVADAEGIDTDAMQRITQWLNLSETTFLLPPTTPEADYRVRIFTLERELPFAGHPTLGTCHAWLAAGGVPKQSGRIVQECGAGLVPIRQDAAGLAFAAPPLIRTGAVDEARLEEVAAFLRISRAEIVDAQWVDNGPGWIGVMLASAEAVLAVEPARSHGGRIEVGVVGPHPAGQDISYELRAFFSDQHGGIVEDPVTGSLNASVAQWLFASGRVQGSYRAAQGTRLGRTGRIRVDRDADGTIWIGGRTATLFSGETAF
ncbi:PhzF family phenazine biosynthesis protein [Edaphosphingomonas haloaromaticamans]|uniref:Trans-2,3-dihydro-3-hydroxyanthranilate isomerase n=1 Tax=Edaphosphingomonas haloaromaticamans TaxID=653954 RepID=A0A1S1HI78_9SPHN|nr:PhzF family phenazine biosynthesis protein [Sphingomonas haloaromaticamans]OHT21542.1 Trans-2,3-dihydro-3-hydroxyanthranilate isomerase [Sphingomonas haloaromaticamans]